MIFCLRLITVHMLVLAGEGEEGSEVAPSHLEAAMRELKPTEAQYAFGKQLQLAMDRLFDYLEIPPADRSRTWSSGVARAWSFQKVCSATCPR